MRYTPIQYVTDGSYLARPLINENGNILLNQGVKLSTSLLNKIRSLGFHAIYIQDALSEYEVEDVIKPELKQKVLKTFKSFLNSVPQTKGYLVSRKTIEENEKQLQETIKDIIEDLFSQRDVVISMRDIKKADDYTYGHSVNVMLHATVLGIGANLNREQLYDLAIGSLLHDIGKLFIPEDILKKPDKLSHEEYAVIQEHTTKGYEFLKNYSNFPATSRIVSLQHQERVNGSGYPKGLTDKDLHPYSKITAIADVYDALTSDRYYRRALPPNEALEYILGGAGRNFNTELTKIFVSRINPYPTGTLVKLSNQMEGIIDQVNPLGFQRPSIKILVEGEKRVSPWILDLSKERNVVIEGIIYQLSK